jgi:hypothetical protein
MWRTRALEAEAKAIDTDSLPEFLGAICRDTVLTGDQKKHRSWSASAMSLSFVLHTTSAKAYRFLKSNFALPSVSVISERIGPILHSRERNLLSLDAVGGAVQSWRFQWGVSPDDIVPAILAGDAASFVPQKLREYEYRDSSAHVHAFMVLPINPVLRSFVVHVLPHPNGSLSDRGEELYRSIVDILLELRVQIISIATDGDRGFCPYQASLFPKYEDLILGGWDIVACCAAAFEHETDKTPQIWWIADCLHALKCQRCRLSNNLALSPTMPPINAASLNATLHLRYSLRNLGGAAKMNDIFAVQLFSVDNLIALLAKGDVYGAYYLTPFVMWYAAISISELDVSLRFDLLAISFVVLRDWFRQGFTEAGRIPDGKFFTEKIDLIRYLNTILFLHEALGSFPEIALNRIGTHPVENLFGLMRVASNADHRWERCKGAIIKATLMKEILFVHNIRSPVRRNFSLAGVKCRNSSHQDLLGIHGFGDRGIACAERMRAFVMHPEATARPPDLPQWLDDLRLLDRWKNSGHGGQLYTPGRIANETEVSRIIGYSSVESEGEFKWTKRRIRKAMELHDNPSSTFESIASKLGCDPDEVRKMLQMGVPHEDVRDA